MSNETKNNKNLSNYELFSYDMCSLDDLNDWEEPTSSKEYEKEKEILGGCVCADSFGEYV